MNQVLFVVSGDKDETALFFSLFADMANRQVAIVTPDSLRGAEPDWDYSPITAVNTQQLSPSVAETIATRLHKSLIRQRKRGVLHRGLLVSCRHTDDLPWLDKLKRDRLHIDIRIARDDAKQGMRLTIYKEDVRVVNGMSQYFLSMMQQVTPYLLKQLPANEPAAKAPGEALALEP